MSFDRILTRRTLVINGLVGATVVIAGCDYASRNSETDELPLVKDDDPVALSVAYYSNTKNVPDDNPLTTSHNVNQKCSNCTHKREYVGSDRIICGTFPGRTVSVDGWCSIYAKG